MVPELSDELRAANQKWGLIVRVRIGAGCSGRAVGWLGVLVAVALVAAGCTSGSDTATVTVTVQPGQTSASVTAPALGDGGTSSAASPSTQISSANGVRFTAKPKLGTKDVAPNDPVTLTVFSAKFQSVTMTADDGATIDGKISDDKATWTTTERLNYNTKYTVEGTAIATLNGAKVPIKGTVTTVNPKKTLGIQINIPDGGVVGIAAPIIVTFLGQVTDRAAAEKALTVTTSAGDKVQGNWAWVQDEDFQSLGYKQSQVHWRPTKSPAGATPYWPAGTKVTVTAALKGVNYGGSVWGRDDVTSSFSIRTDGLIVKADASSHRLVVTINDSVVKNWPVAYGKESVPGRSTLNGIHVVTNKYPEYAMCNPSFDYCNAEEKWAVRINNNGEFIHENLKAAAAFGTGNVSHGCINMGEPAAQEFYAMAKFGDPVEVTNSLAPDGQPGPSLTEQDALYDWIYSADDWKALSAIG